VLSLALSLDGFIAEPDGGVSWLDGFDAKDVQKGLESFWARTKVLVMGRATYDKALTFGPWPFAGKRTVVLTRRALRGAPEGVETHGGTPRALVAKLGKTTRGIVWHMGGGRSARPFLDGGLVDELRLDVIPKTLGKGIPLFQADARPLRLALLENHAYSNGIVRLRYRVRPKGTR
jgi:dihydrofolate reductase